MMGFNVAPAPQQLKKKENKTFLAKMMELGMQYSSLVVLQLQMLVFCIYKTKRSWFIQYSTVCV
jgi:hypothetical protein